MCVTGAQADQKRVTYSLELELDVTVSLHVEAGNQTQLSAWAACGLNHGASLLAPVLPARNVLIPFVCVPRSLVRTYLHL